MQIIDGHMHVLESVWIPETIRRAWARQAIGRQIHPRQVEDVLPKVAVGHSDPGASLTIAAFDACGIEAGVIPTVDWTVGGSELGEHLPIRDLHVEYQKLGAEHPGRLFHCAGVDPRHKDARDIAVTALNARHCVGIKLYPLAGWDLDAVENQWVFSLALEHGVPVMVHTAAVGGDPMVNEMSRPSRLGPLMSRFPTLSVIMGHAGFEAWWNEAIDIASGYGRASLDVSLWQDVAERDYPEFRKRMKLMLHRLGAHRILWGSDIIRGPREDPQGDRLRRWLGMFMSLAESFAGEAPIASAGQMELMLGGSAIQTFGLEGET